MPAAAFQDGPHAHSFIIAHGRDGGNLPHLDGEGGRGRLTSTAPTGLSPATIESAYGFSTSSSVGTNQTVAIVDAYDDPTAAADLNTFDAEYALPACTTKNGCFTKVSQTGSTTRLPAANAGWALEISLDVQWAHAIAPGAKILLVEASSSSLGNLLTAETYAVGHAKYVSNSWDSSEFSGETSYDGYFTAKGVSYFVAAGDSGTPATWPSASPNVISVGGTTLNLTNGVFSSETGWSDGGGGCSAYETANTAESSFTGASNYPGPGYSNANCPTIGGKPGRATPDVSLDANPYSGVSIYDSTRYEGQSGWFQVGGTSVATPIWAARSADTGATVNAAYVYVNPTHITFRDIQTVRAAA